MLDTVYWALVYIRPKVGQAQKGEIIYNQSAGFSCPLVLTYGNCSLGGEDIWPSFS